MTALCVAAPVSGLEWRQWGRTVVEVLELTSGEANLLRLLCDRVSAGGSVRLGVPLMARQLVLSESQVHRFLSALGRRGLMRTRQMGRGRVAVRELVAVPEPVQLSLFDAPAVERVATAPAPVVPSAPSFRPVAATASRPAAVQSSPRMGASMPSHQCDPAVEGQVVEEEKRAARAGTTINDPLGVLSPRLGEVLAILEPALGAIVEPLAFDSALSAFPEERGHDHVQAAHIVASYGFDGEVRSPISLLRQVLRNQLPAARRTDRWHGGRRRGSAPLTAEVQEQIDRENAGAARLLARMGLGQPR